MGRGRAAVLGAVQIILANHKQPSPPPSNLERAIGIHPVFKRSNPVTRENRIYFPPLLNPCEELANAGAFNAYESTLSILASIHNAISNVEPPYALAKRFVAFAICIPKTFLKFVDKQRPRALAILAHYFSLLAQSQLSL
jgi:hypothetical protein